MTDHHHDTVAPERTGVTVGVSAGSDVVCCAVLTTGADGTETFDHRTVTSTRTSTRALHRSSGLTATSLDLATEHLLSGARLRDATDGVVVAHRGTDDSRAILAAVRRHDLSATNLAPEHDAALCWLRHTGEVARYGTVVIADVGASGTSVTVIDQVDGTVHSSVRSEETGGTVFDARVLDAVSTRLPEASATDRAVVAARLRTAKEQLSFRDSVTVDLTAHDSLTVTRDELVTALTVPLDRLRACVREAVSLAGPSARPDAVAVIGGGGYVPAVVAAVAEAAAATAVFVDQPDTVVAKGAALLARSTDRRVLRAPVTRPVTVASGVRSIGLLACACAVVAVVAAYGLQTLTPSSEPSITTSSGSVLRTSAADTVPDTTRPSLTGGWYDGDAPIDRNAVVDDGPSAPDLAEPTYYPQAPTRQDSGTIDVAPLPALPTAEPTPSLRPAPDLPVIIVPGMPPIPPWWSSPSITPPEVVPAPESTAPVPTSTGPADPTTGSPTDTTTGQPTGTTPDPVTPDTTVPSTAAPNTAAPNTVTPSTAPAGGSGPSEPASATEPG